jgi:RecA/RadA recombinase
LILSRAREGMDSLLFLEIQMANKTTKVIEKELSTTLSSLPEPEGLSTGLTLLDLAGHGKIGAGILKGHLYRFAGRSSSGKTFVCRTILAEAANSPLFDGYELIYDDVERGALMDTEKFFGKKLLDRLTPPARGKNKEPLYSNTIQEFYNRAEKKLKDGKKCIWVLDSLDALDSEVITKMSDSKAKVNSQRMRCLIDPLQETGSIMIIISQVRADMTPPIPGMKKFGPPEDVIAGGRAPEFYSTFDVILRKSSAIKVTYKEKKYTRGHWVTAKVSKNRLSGMDQTVKFPFYPSFGIDDIGSCIQYLVDVQHWKETKGILEVEDFNFTGRRDALIAKIEDGLYDSLRNLTAKVWKEIQDALYVGRKKRYE